MASDEKNLPAPQSATKKNARIPRPDGLARRTQGAQAPARKGTQTPGDLDSAQTARLASKPPRFGFGPESRLHASWEFTRVQRHGVRAQSAHFVLYALQLAPSDETRLGIAVSRRIGNAVVRNRVKRRVRECFRLKLRPMIPSGAAMVVIALAGAGALETPTINAELEAATLVLAKGLKGRD